MFYSFYLIVDRFQGIKEVFSFFLGFFFFYCSWFSFSFIIVCLDLIFIDAAWSTLEFLSL